MRVSVLLILIFIVKISISQVHTINFDVVDNKAEKIYTDNNSVVFNFIYKGIDILEVKTRQGIYNKLVVPNTYRSGVVGNPQLVSTYKLVEIPKNCKISVEIKNYTEKEYKINDYATDYKIVPYQPTYKKNINTDTVIFIKNKQEYLKNSYNSSKIVELKVLGDFRDKRIAKIVVNPIKYNPVTNTIKFYNNIKIKLKYSYTKSVQIEQNKGLESIYFNQYNKRIESAVPQSTDKKYNDKELYPAKYLIVTHSNYLNTLKEFINWKVESGFNVEVLNLDTIGADASKIKDYIRSIYNNSTKESPAPSFILLVGDVQQIPASQNGNSTNKITDLYYASIDDDMFPDIYYGRLPAQDTLQLKDMLSKILIYEKYQFVEDDFFNDVTLIAGKDDEWNPRVGKPAVEYSTNFYFNATNGFDNVNAYISDYNGCYMDSKIGVGLVTYTAHCTRNSWLNPLLKVEDINNFHNDNKYPVVIGNCCLSCDFSIDECVGEAWIRKKNGGSIAYLGSVPNTYWWEDFYWTVGAHSPLYNTYPNKNESGEGVYDAPFNREVFIGELLFTGNMAVTQAHNESFMGDINSTYYWEAYHCLGDPSLQPYLTKGSINSVNHSPIFQQGINFFKTKAIPGALIAISNKYGLIGVAIANTDSVAVIKTDTLTQNDSIKIVITKYGYKPYIKQIPVVEVDDSYLIVEQVVVNDEIDGNGNGELDFDEKLNFNIVLKNIGKKISENVEVSIISKDKYLDISNNKKTVINSIDINEIVNLNDNFDFKIKDSVTDGYLMLFDIILSDSLPNKERVYYNSHFYKKVNAPNLKILNYQHLDDFMGNGNGIVDVDEDAILKLAISNMGNTQVSATVSLSNISVIKSIDVDNNKIKLDEFKLNDTVFLDYNLTLNSPQISKKDTLLLKIESGKYLIETLVFLHTQQLFKLQTGTDNIELNSYPFNNYYKNNSTQIIYLRAEVGEDVKALKSISFDISEYTTDEENRSLHNFKIKLLQVSQKELCNPVKFNDVEIIYSSNIYVLPNNNGWNKFTLQKPIILSENKNFIIELSWGENTGYTVSDITSVNCTKTSFKSVAWGYSDTNYPAVIDNVGNKRPNTKFEFDSVGILNILVNGDLPVDDYSSKNIEDCRVSIDTTVKLTDRKGRTKFYFNNHIGDYNIKISKYGYSDTVIFLHKIQLYSNIDVTLKRNSKFTLFVKDSNLSPVVNALVYIDTNKYYTDNYGKIIDYSCEKGNYIKYTVEKEQYYTITDSVQINLLEKEQTLLLPKEYFNLTIDVSDDKGKVDSAKVTIGNNILFTDKFGRVHFSKMHNGEYNYTIEKNSYLKQKGSVTIDNKDTVINVLLVIVDINNKYLGVKLYPNPTVGVFYIETVKDIQGARYEIINNNGVIILRGDILNSIQKIDLNKQSKGVYILKLTIDNKNVVYSIILK